MPLYKYRAVTFEGEIRNGRLDAANEPDLEKRLAKMRLELIKATATLERKAVIGQKKVEKRDIIIFCMHMGQLTEAGVPILEGLTDLRDSLDHPRFKEVVTNLIETIEGGKSLSQSLEEYPLIFDSLFVNLIRAGEASGQLSEVFHALATMIKWQDELNASTKKLVMAPMFVGGVVVAVIGFLMAYLVPQLVGFIASIGEELPFHTKALIFTSDLIVNWWYLWIFIPVGAVLLVQMALRTSEKARMHADRLKLRIPQIGPVLQKIALSRFTSFFSMMYAAGVPILRSLEIAESILDNRVIKAAIAQARQEIEQGQPVSDSLETTGMFPPLVLRMVKVGEATGQLDKALTNVSYFYERDIKDSIDKLQAMIQPAMTLFLGMILAWVMLSVLGPVYNSLSTITM